MAQHETVKSAAAASGNPQRILEKCVPLSSSVIWRMQRDYYAARALKAWTEDQVPAYITNNPFIAEIYARIIAAFLQDCCAQKSFRPSRQNPLRVLELGAGTGKFAYLLLRKLTESLSTLDVPSDALRYVMTECSGKVLEEWQANPYLSEFAEQGVLEFGIFEAERSASGDERFGTKARGPLVVIANYVFDSLAQDAFAIDNGRLYEILLTTSCESEAQDFQNLRFSFDQFEISSARYPDAGWNRIIDQYRTRFPAATVLFPTATLNTLERLSEVSDGRLLVLAADKGVCNEDAVGLLQGDPPLEFHASQQCFSQMVNFDAIAKYFCNKGGEALLPQKRFTSLNLCGLLNRPPGEEFSSTRNSYQQSANAFGPDDLFAIMSWLNDRLEQIPLAQAISLLRLTRWDPTALARLFPALARQARHAGAERNDLRDAVRKTWQNHYPLSREENIVAFYCGVILLELRFFSEAYEMLRKSQELFESSAATSYNLGLCCLGMDQPGDALDLMREACSLDPGFEPAQQSRLKLESQLKQ